MTIYDNVFPLGLGTNRFLVGAATVEQDLERAVEIVLRALDLGVNYIDTASTYSGGYATEVLRRALRRTDKSYRITAKVYPYVKTADATRRSVEEYLTALGICHASDFMVWSISSYAEFKSVMRPGGIYAGALKLKAEGIIEHIVCSVHAQPEDMIKILKENVFSGMMISMSALNSIVMQPVLECADEMETGIAVMNPLGGGFIPQKKDQFTFLLNECEDSIVQSALRFVKAQPAVKLVLAGPSTVKELEEDVKAFSAEDLESEEHRRNRVSAGLFTLSNFCTGCRYCEPCPKGIQIPLLMQCRNALAFEPPEAYRCTDPETLKNIQVFKRMDFEYHYLPETDENPCIECGQCERRCTQKLPVIENVADMFARIRQTRYSKKVRRDWLDQLLNQKGYQKVAIWPGGVPSGDLVVQTYQELFGNPPFEFVYFNSSLALHGKIVNGHQIYGPEDLLTIKPGCVLIVSYPYGRDIARSLEPYQDQGIDILRLYLDGDVPWLY